MAQTKKKSQKSTSKKQPVKVQLSKEDLVELLTVLKKFLEEETAGTHRAQTHRLDCHNQRITTLEIVENNHRAEIRELKRHCVHEDRVKSIWYSVINNRVLGLNYECRLCGRESQKTWFSLTRKEKRGLKKLRVTV